ncbi:MAG: response regulator [Bacteroidia bacterium]
MSLFQRAMLLDDSKLSNLVTAKMLEQDEVADSIKTFTDAKEALEHLLKAESPESGIMLVDIHMPGMDGFEFLDEVLKVQTFNRLPWTIFMLSSSISPEDKKRAEAHPLVDDYIMKPLKTALLHRFSKTA